MNSSENKNSWFKKYITIPIDKFSKWLKGKTTQNLQDWILAILFFGGLIFIWIYPLRHWVYSFYQDSILLWFTFIAIMWYTKETFWLKHVNEELLKTERKNIELSMMPIISMDKPIIENNKFKVRIKNIGKGIAKHIEGQVLIYDQKYILKDTNEVKRILQLTPGVNYDLFILLDLTKIHKVKELFFKTTFTYQNLFGINYCSEFIKESNKDHLSLNFKTLNNDGS